MPVVDLWPEFRAPEDVNSPIFLLKQQAAALERKTKGLVGAELKSAVTPDKRFWVGFDLYSPALGEYSYRLFEVTYPPEFYPLTFSGPNGDEVASTPDNFRVSLVSALQATRTRQVVEAIMAQATALGGPGPESGNGE
jgi:hypothetical protein